MSDKWNCLLILIFFFTLCASQETISSDKSTIPLKEVLRSIELNHQVTFYYIQEWVEDVTVDSLIMDKDFPQILDVLFQNTDLNYYRTDNKRIILTQNSVIYEALPDGFFEKREHIQTTLVPSEEVAIPQVFYREGISTNEPSIQKFVIGKASAGVPTKEAVISGIITNNETKEPIPDLAIRVRGKSIRAVTDDQGYYELRLPIGVYFLELRALGIENSVVEAIIYNTGTLNISLSEGLEQLEEVVVRADAKKNVEEAATGTTTVDSEASKNIPIVLGERDILKIAASLPGVTTAGEGAAGYNVRGGKTDQNLFLLDNALIYNPSHFFGIFQAINPFTTEGVDIYKGHIPASYGGRLSSVFDIRTKSGATDSLRGEASLGPVTGNIALELPIVKGKSSFIFGGRGTYSDWILRSLDDPTLSSSTANFFDVIGKYEHKINDKNTLSTEAYYSRDAFSITVDSLYTYSNRIFSLNWNHTYKNDKLRGDLILYNSDYQFNIDFDGETDTDFVLKYKVNESQLKYVMKYALNPSHALNFGISTKFYKVQPGSIEPGNSDSSVSPRTIPREKGLESAIFLSDAFSLSDKFLIDIGVRYSIFAVLGPSIQRSYEEGQPRNENTQTDTQEFANNEIIETYGSPEYRLSGRYLLIPSFSLKASFNTGYQYIHTLSNNTTVSPLDTYKLSDLNIKPQEGNQYALGLYKNLEGNAYEISLEGYYKRYDNALDFKTGADLLLNENIEREVLQGEGKAYGIEFLIRKNIGNLNGWLGYTYSRSFLKFDSEFSEERINNGDFFPANYDKPHDVSLVANYRITRRYSISTNFVYQTGRPVTYPLGTFQFNNASFVYYSDRNKFRIPDYYRLDLGINIEGNHKLYKPGHSFWTISVYNVLGRNNPYSVFFVTDDGEVKALQSSIFSIPIPSITYNFKF